MHLNTILHCCILLFFTHSNATDLPTDIHLSKQPLFTLDVRPNRSESATSFGGCHFPDQKTLFAAKFASCWSSKERRRCSSAENAINWRIFAQKGPFASGKWRPSSLSLFLTRTKFPTCYKWTLNVLSTQFELKMGFQRALNELSMRFKCALNVLSTRPELKLSFRRA